MTLERVEYKHCRGFFLIHPRFSSTRAAFSRRDSRPNSRLFQGSRRIKNGFRRKRELLGNAGQVSDLKRLNRVTVRSAVFCRTDSSSKHPLPLLSVRSAVTDPYRRLQSPSCRAHFFFCTSCSIFRPAVLFGSTLSRLFRFSSQALMSCRNDNEN